MRNIKRLNASGILLNIDFFEKLYESFVLGSSDLGFQKFILGPQMSHDVTKSMDFPNFA
jgi:hypothetical protein